MTIFTDIVNHIALKLNRSRQPDLSTTYYFSSKEKLFPFLNLYLYSSPGFLLDVANACVVRKSGLSLAIIVEVKSTEGHLVSRKIYKRHCCFLTSYLNHQLSSFLYDVFYCKMPTDCDLLEGSVTDDISVSSYFSSFNELFSRSPENSLDSDARPRPQLLNQMRFLRRHPDFSDTDSECIDTTYSDVSEDFSEPSLKDSPTDLMYDDLISHYPIALLKLDVLLVFVQNRPKNDNPITIPVWVDFSSSEKLNEDSRSSNSVSFTTEGGDIATSSNKDFSTFVQANSLRTIKYDIMEFYKYLKILEYYSNYYLKSAALKSSFEGYLWLLRRPSSFPIEFPKKDFSVHSYIERKKSKTLVDVFRMNKNLFTKSNKNLLDISLMNSLQLPQIGNSKLNNYEVLQSFNSLQFSNIMFLNSGLSILQAKLNMHSISNSDLVLSKISYLKFISKPFKVL
jgi:hypothetical protein